MSSKGICLNPVILIVEDQGTDALVLSEMVRDLGDVFLASNGSAALVIAKQCRPDLVLLDIEMHGMNGFAVCKALKADPELCDAAVIFVTSHTQTANELRALEYGGIDFIRKPLQPALAKAYIKAHLALRMEAKRLANHDALTGLPNRTLLQDRTEHALQVAHRNQTRVAMLLLDLDNFKGIDNTLGAAISDALLTETAARLTCAARAVDTVSRQGGDEFVLLLPEVSDCDAVNQFAERLLTRISAPFLLEEDRYSLNASIGISLFPDDANDAESLYRNASAAMHRAKIEGRNRVCFFSAAIERSTRCRHLLEQKMRIALEDKAFEVFYQPKMATHSETVIGVEALVRWRQTDGSFISPADFIPLAEETGLIIPLGEYVLRQACKDAQTLIDQGNNLIVSVNISTVQFGEDNFLQMVHDILQATGLEPEFLELEITEGVLAKDVNKTRQVLAALRQKGVRIAIDDFGTGYSSLAYLKSFPIDVLKIDQSFVRDMLSDKSDAAIIEAIITLAKALDLEMVAEGVETQDQAEALQNYGCDIMQGYLYFRPVPFLELCGLLGFGTITTP
ncbi:EAL domain-containing protein [Halopseudomonas sp.]|jgi:diguanylate cyclase (GGDEF)-like protein|uniref:two-component system response regulator n=1 Tax=Halopseudomonas sp. TaxID=2901191 RepID=UPI0039E40AF3